MVKILTFLTFLWGQFHLTLIVVKLTTIWVVFCNIRITLKRVVSK